MDAVHRDTQCVAKRRIDDSCVVDQSLHWRVGYPTATREKFQFYIGKYFEKYYCHHIRISLAVRVWVYDTR